MARRKPAKKATKKSAARKTATLRRAQGGPERNRGARKPAKKTVKKTSRKTAIKTAKKPSRKAPKASRKAPKKAPKKALKKAAAPSRRASGTKAAAKKKVAKPKPKAGVIARMTSFASAAVAAGAAALTPKKKPNLDRPRKTVADVHGIPSSLDMNRSASSAKSGRAEMQDKLSKNNSGGAAITAGDVDADWQSAESVGDEAPGGDNPTPDQDRVDDIGRALGVEYADDEELQGGAEIADRDLNRWELDPASKDDFEDDED